MLVLSRKVGEVICIGDSIRVTVVEIGQGRVRLGIVAPRTVSVDRLEVRERAEREQKEPHARGE
jgi:carbon storage regulator